MIQLKLNNLTNENSVLSQKYEYVNDVPKLSPYYVILENVDDKNLFIKTCDDIKIKGKLSNVNSNITIRGTGKKV